MLPLSLSVSTSLCPRLSPPWGLYSCCCCCCSCDSATLPACCHCALDLPHFKNYCYYMRCSDKNRRCPAPRPGILCVRLCSSPLETTHEIRPGCRRESRRNDVPHAHMQQLLCLCIKNNYNCSHDFPFQECCRCWPQEQCNCCCWPCCCSCSCCSCRCCWGHSILTHINFRIFILCYFYCDIWLIDDI